MCSEIVIVPNQLPAPRAPRYCQCGEFLTLECEFDSDECVDCQAERALNEKEISA